MSFSRDDSILLLSYMSAFFGNIFMPQLGPHEDLTRDHAVSAGSERSFGLVFATFFVVVGAFGAWHQAGAFWAWLATGLVLAAVAWTTPSVLRPLNRLWFRFG